MRTTPIPNHASSDDWFADVARTLSRSYLASIPLLAFDAADGRLVGATTAAQTLLGVTVPSHFDDL